ncbi:hypothetical protein HK097_003015 [Rhizophlyctis rosea]|uniref:Uncharacterized protein n=1 Tax=Rhizophlyctis rosea TaxID=64517 RepID=A0AAD5SF69_9FUNG|nr:hypothetical protein HK097_003015 [Rhizophlyctis rosea]
MLKGRAGVTVSDLFAFPPPCEEHIASPAAEVEVAEKEESPVPEPAESAEPAEEPNSKFHPPPTNIIRDHRPTFYYPADPRLPWHFSWIDDGMMAGMSAPTEPHHYRALADAGVGLIVNLTEAPICPPSPSENSIICNSCDFIQEPHPTSLFDELLPTDSLHVLHLPIHDGTTPTPSQIHIFLKHARDYIRRGKKVAVHCQAGVGRTGLFLALYILTKHNITAQAAVSRLRRIRPQSMRFHRKDWATDPFDRHLGEVVGKVTEEDVWNVNKEQIKFVEEWVARDDVGELERAYVGAALEEHCSTACYACRDIMSVGPIPIRKPASSVNAEEAEFALLELAPIRLNGMEVVNLDKLPSVQAVFQSYLAGACATGGMCVSGRGIGCADCDLVVPIH